MQYLVSENDLTETLALLTTRSRLSLDTETTGLEPFKGDRAFSVIIADEQDEYYFDFNIGGLNKVHLPRVLEAFNRCGYGFFINFDFDYTMLAMDAAFVKGPKILDGGVLARLENSLHAPSGKKAENQFFSMDYLAKYYLGKEKDTTVEQYIKDYDLYGVDSKGKKKPLYKKVPLKIMFKYGCNDARLTFDIGTEIIRRINGRDKFNESTRPKSWPKIMDCLANESKLSTALVENKFRGMLLDKEFCTRARIYELARAEELLLEIKKTVNLNVNSPKQVANYLMTDLGLKLPKIIKKGKWTGGYSTDAKTLDALAEEYSMPILQKIVGAKQAQKKANTYYKNYLAMADKNNIIRCSLGQETTVSGRLSGFQPNLQNVHKENYHEYAVRNSFIARKGFKLFFFDYKGQEMYVMIDLSGDQDVIEKVKNGVDIYIAMAEMVEKYTGIKITRQQAKALALGVAYGQGIALIAKNLRCSEAEAKKLRSAFKDSLTGVIKLDTWCKDQAKRYGKIHNPYGRVSLIEKGFEYKTLNALIQGTSADITKTAYVNCTTLLQGYESSVVLTVHDEVIFELKDGEEFLVPQINQIMIDAYPHKHLPLRVDIEVSSTSWAAKETYNAAV